MLLGQLAHLLDQRRDTIDLFQSIGKPSLPDLTPQFRPNSEESCSHVGQEAFVAVLVDEREKIWRDAKQHRPQRAQCLDAAEDAPLGKPFDELFCELKEELV